MHLGKQIIMDSLCSMVFCSPDIEKKCLWELYSIFNSLIIIHFLFSYLSHSGTYQRSEVCLNSDELPSLEEDLIFFGQIGGLSDNRRTSGQFDQNLSEYR